MFVKVQLLQAKYSTAYTIFFFPHVKDPNKVSFKKNQSTIKVCDPEHLQSHPLILLCHLISPFSTPVPLTFGEQ